jgi:hypothetical protein
LFRAGQVNVIIRPFGAAFEATTKSHERDQRSNAADRVRIVETIGWCAGALSIRNSKQCQVVNWCFGGRGGIRTHGTLAGTPVFKTGALNHSATLPNLEIA